MQIGLLEGSADVADFDPVVAQYGPRIFRFALASLCDRDAAETVPRTAFSRPIAPGISSAATPPFIRG
jgi:hypothetical protein